MDTRGHTTAHDRRTIDDAAVYLQCSRRTVFRLLGERAFPSVKIGRERLIERADLDAYVEHLKSST